MDARISRAEIQRGGRVRLGMASGGWFGWMSQREALASLALLGAEEVSIIPDEPNATETAHRFARRVPGSVVIPFKADRTDPRD